jgi:hypothetical protein
MTGMTRHNAHDLFDLWDTYPLQFEATPSSQRKYVAMQGGSAIAGSDAAQQPVLLRAINPGSFSASAPNSGDSPSVLCASATSPQAIVQSAAMDNSAALRTVAQSLLHQPCPQFRNQSRSGLPLQRQVLCCS